ncbi:phage tail protein [Actinophytocola glycyrrhizae]|uniref:Phage tail protein n=1 Tax=Actinophytocola glycyrrhizae TaxID=2044873 RepID=A0ABV9SAC3_9PSEU
MLPHLSAPDPTAIDLTTESLPLVEPVSASRFFVNVLGWSQGLGFTELAGFNSAVNASEYSYNGRLGNVRTKQFGRPSPPTITLKRGLDSIGFAQLFAWHTLARGNNPVGKVPATFTILAASGLPVAACTLENAWCSRLEIDPAQAGGSNVVMMKVTIECDDIVML